MPATSSFITKSVEVPARIGWRGWLALLLASAVLAVLFVLPPALTQSVITDELYTLHAITLPTATFMHEFYQYTRDTWDHPPLFFLIQRAAYLLLGDDPLALRSVALVCMVVGSALWAGGVGRLGAGWAGAGALCLWLMLHPELRQQAAFCRMYTMLLLGCCATLLAAWSLPGLRGGALVRRALLTGGLLAVSVYISYFAIMFGVGLGAMGVCWAIWPGLACGEVKPAEEKVPDNRWTGRHAGLALVGACCFAALLLLPWLPPILKLTHMQDRMELATFSRTFQFGQIVQGLAGGNAGLVILPLGWVWVAWLRRGDRARWLLALVCLWALPFGMLAKGAPADKPLAVRYLLFTIPILWAGALLGWWALGDRLARGAASARAAWRFAFALLPVPGFVLFGRAAYFNPNPEWWGFANALVQNYRPGEQVLTGGYLSGDAIQYAARKLAQKNALTPPPIQYLHGRMDIDAFYGSCKDPRVMWYVNAAPLPPGYADIVERYFPWRVQVRCSRIQFLIMLAAKKPFTLWDGTPAEQFPVKVLPYEK